MKKPMLFCHLCGEGHRFLNPRQFTTWVKRHRKLKHPRYRGTIRYLPAHG